MAVSYSSLFVCFRLVVGSTSLLYWLYCSPP